MSDGETCDDGALNANGYGELPRCNESCSDFAPHCGDGVQQAVEACDDGDRQDDGNGCSVSCQRTGTCGNGEVESYFETCDDGNTETETCPYGQESCIVCVGLDYHAPQGSDLDAPEGCQFRERVGTWCGDGVVQQAGLIGGGILESESDYARDSGAWEGCDPGSEDSPVAAVQCASLAPSLGTGTAHCQSSCIGYDLSACENQAMVYVPAGPFMMGCNEAIDGDCDEDEKPYHQVQLSAFLIDRYEVSADEYAGCVATGACTESWAESANCNFQVKTDGTWAVRRGRGTHPANCVTYAEAVSYCAWAQKRLPTEAEWEKAALGTTRAVFPWGTSLPTCDRAVVNGWYYNPNDIDANANGYVEGYGCGRDGTWDVLGTGFEAGISPYGGVHMSGNVTEWVSDWYSEDYTALIDQADPQGVTEGELRAARGGSWSSFKVNLRAANRGYFDPLRFSSSFGFRCATNAPDLAEE